MEVMKKALSFVLSWMLGICLSAQHATLMVKSADSGTKGSISRYSDPVVMSELKLKEFSLTKQYQAFELEFEGEHAYFQLNAGESNAGFYLSSRDTLELDFSAREERWKILGGSAAILNNRLAVIDSMCDDILLKSSLLPLSKRTKELRYFSDTLRKNSTEPSAFIRNYIQYRTAYLEIITDSRKRTDINLMHFSIAAQPSNMAWVESFQSLFKGYFAQKLNGRNGADLKALMVAKDIQGIRSFMASDTSLRNADVRDLILLLGLYNESREKQFDKELLVQLVSKIAESSADGTVKLVGQIILEDWLRYAKGRDCEDFTFGQPEKALRSLVGKPIYFCYYPVFDQDVSREILMLKGIYAKYKSEMHFLVVVKTNAVAGLEKAISAMQPGFDVVTLSSCSSGIDSLLEKEDRTTYILLDRQGKIFQAPAEGPETGVEAAFTTLIKK
jgi:hypothetical protein